jgi:hypothetical protein
MSSESIPLEDRTWYLISLTDAFARQLAHADDVDVARRDAAAPPHLLDAGEPKLDGDASRWLGRVGSALAFDSDPLRVGEQMAALQRLWFGETDAAVGVRPLTLDEKRALFESARLARCSLAHADNVCAKHFVCWIGEKHDATVARATSFLRHFGLTAAEGETLFDDIRKANREAAPAAAAAAGAATAAPVSKRRRRGRSPR